MQLVGECAKSVYGPGPGWRAIGLPTLAESVREQMAAFLGRIWRALGNTCPTTPFHGFTDVPATSFANADITCLKALGITTGTGDGTTFSPFEAVTREQMAAFLARLIDANADATNH